MTSAVIEEFVPVTKNTLRGFARVRLPSGLILHDVAIHQRDGTAWASPASKPMLNRDGHQMKDQNGKLLWSPIISFTSREVRDRLNTAILDCVAPVASGGAVVMSAGDQHLAATPGELAAAVALRTTLWQHGWRPMPVYSASHTDPVQRGKAPLGAKWQERAAQNPPECVRLAAAVPWAMNTGLLASWAPAARPRHRRSRTRRSHSRTGDYHAGQHDRPHARELAPLPAALSRRGGRASEDRHHRRQSQQGQRLQDRGIGQGPAIRRLRPAPIRRRAPMARGRTRCNVRHSRASNHRRPTPSLPERRRGADRRGTAGREASAPCHQWPRQEHDGATSAHILDVIAALAVIPNDDPADWEHWNAVGMATWAASGGSIHGFNAWCAWSAQHPEHDVAACRERWNHYPTSPPDRTGAGKLFAMARDAWPDWQRPSQTRRQAQGTPAIVIRVIDPTELEFAPVPPRLWVVQDWLPIGTVTGNYGDGGTGKTLLSQLLQTSCATCIPWAGQRVLRCKSFGIYCEDTEEELHRRQDDINTVFDQSYSGPRGYALDQRRRR